MNMYHMKVEKITGKQVSRFHDVFVPYYKMLVKN